MRRILSTGYPFCAASLRPNPAVNWTRNGMAPLGLISLWPSGTMPLRASYLSR